MAVSKKKNGRLDQSVTEAMASAKRAMTKTTLTKGRKPQAGELFNFRLDPTDKAQWTETFNECGVTLSAGIKLATYYIIQELKAGRLQMTKAGLFPVSRGL